MQLFFLLLAAHICGDFFLYSPGMSTAKRVSDVGKRFKAVAIHCFYHALIIVFVLWIAGYGLGLIAQAAIFISILHFIVDVSRIHIEGFVFEKKDFAILKRKDVFAYLTGNKNAECSPFMGRYFRRWVFMNLADQGLHITIILLFLTLADSGIFPYCCY